jgi:hypothetical protein
LHHPRQVASTPKLSQEHPQEKACCGSLREGVAPSSIDRVCVTVRLSATKSCKSGEDTATVGSMGIIRVDAWQCDLCRHIWYTKSEEPPKACAKCKRRNWNQGAKARIEREEQSASPKPPKMIIAKPEPPKAGKCPRCDGPTVPWGSMRRCQNCKQNW